MATELFDPTNIFTNLELQNGKNEALKLWKGRWGSMEIGRGGEF